MKKVFLGSKIGHLNLTMQPRYPFNLISSLPNQFLSMSKNQTSHRLKSPDNIRKDYGFSSPRWKNN
jgi:hypothetical protein